jgi:hypothetical protein
MINTNLFQEKKETLKAYAEAFLKAEADNNPTLQNQIMRKMTITADRLFVSAFDFLADFKKQNAKASEADAKANSAKAGFANVANANSKKANQQTEFANTDTAIANTNKANSANATVAKANFQCRKCSRNFGNVKQLNAHMKAHRKDKESTL